MRGTIRALTAAGALLATLPAGAQTWPAQPIKFVQGFQAGGNPDIVARLLAQPMSEMLGVPVIVEGRIGGGGVLAADMVSKAKPDGYTIWLAPAGFAASVGLHKTLPYDPVNDFQFLSMVLSFPYVIAVTPASPYKSIKDLVAAARAKPGVINYATGGVGTGIHLSMELFLASAGLKMEHIPYRGGTTQVTALISGEVPVLVDTPTPIQTFVDDGKIKPLSLSTKERWSRWPDAPTVAETVIPGFDIKGWLGVGTVKGVPAPIVARLNQAIRAAAAKPDVTEKLLQFGSAVWTTTPEETQSFVAEEIGRWTKVIREAKVPQLE